MTQALRRFYFSAVTMLCLIRLFAGSVQTGKPVEAEEIAHPTTDNPNRDGIFEDLRELDRHGAQIDLSPWGR